MVYHGRPKMPDYQSELHHIDRFMRKHKIRFSKIVTLFLLIKEKGPIGRYIISKELEIPEGITRGAVSDFTKMGIIHTIKKGCIISDLGTNLLSEILEKSEIKKIKDFHFGFLALDRYCAAAQVSQRKNLSVSVLRDKVVKAGASGSIIISYERGKLVVPKVYEDLSALFPPLSEKLKKEFSLASGDILVFAFASKAWKAKEAAISAVIDDDAHLTMTL
ncbi:MAG: hypothetical protein H3Z52_08640 [archaeon]|nr:hypothetical protein [archaeon]MCP8320993.1 hypothetical protein [archaeon]